MLIDQLFVLFHLEILGIIKQKQKATRTKMFIVLLLIQIKEWKQSKFPTNGNLVNNAHQCYGALF